MNKRGRKLGSINAKTKSRMIRPQISPLASAVDSFQALVEQGYMSVDNDVVQLTPKGQKWTESRIKELGMYNVLLFEAYFANAHNTHVDYSDILNAIEDTSVSDAK